MSHPTQSEIKRAERTSCPRCLSLRVVESRRSTWEMPLHFFTGVVPCRCTSCMHRFHAVGFPGWMRSLVDRALSHKVATN